MRTSEVLNRAADLIEERGWTTIHGDGNPWGGDGAPVCIEGAIVGAMGLSVTRNGIGDETDRQLRTCPAYLAMMDYLGLNPMQERLYRFNDAEGRTKAEVVEALRTVAVIEAAKEDVEALRSVK